MRAMRVLLLSTIACSSSPPPVTRPPSTATPTQALPTPERLAQDTPRTTVAGNVFTAPAGWSILVRGNVTLLTPPEDGSAVALVDVQAPDADAAVKAAWAAYKPGMQWPLRLVSEKPDKDGWTQRKNYDYQTSPNEQRLVTAVTQLANGVWTIMLSDMAADVVGKRGTQVGVIFGKLLPKGFVRETFAGKRAHPLDAARIDALTSFVEDARQNLGIPGVALAVLQDGKVVFEGGFGVRQLGRPAKIDADTKFMIASNTKAMATLMLAKLVDQGKLAWDTPATKVMATFKLGDAATTQKVQIKHLICACTGLPRQDMETTFEFDGVTPAEAMAKLATMQPTTAFGELFQYSNALAAAAGFLGGHVAYPKLELGKAYDTAMKSLVFDPLGMKATTHDFTVGRRGNRASPHVIDIDGKTVVASERLNDSLVPVRPSGGAWSTVRDLARYVAMELADGKLPDGSSYIGKEALHARRTPQIAFGADISYGMGLIVETKSGVTVVHHGGDVVGYHSDMMWLPEHGVGLVVLTNGDPGWILRDEVRRRLLEILFDGRPEAEANIAARGATYLADVAAERKLLTVPADDELVAKLAPRYANTALGEIEVVRKRGKTVFDVGEFASEVGSIRHPDGSVSFVTVDPGVSGIELVVGGGPKRTLIVRDLQHEYVFDER